MYYLREKSVHTEDPVFFKLRSDCMVFPNDHIIARDFASSGNYEQAIIEWIASFMDPSKIFLDIGAHVGTYSLYFAPRCAGVHAFECSPKTFNYLCANIALRELDYKIIPHRTALGNKNGMTPYYIRSPTDGGGNGCKDFGDGSATVDVPVTMLDSFNLTNVGMIKLDVEGYEKCVLEGAIETIRSNGYPKLLFECWKEPKNDREKLFEYIYEIGYTNITGVNGWDEMFIAERNTESTS